MTNPRTWFLYVILTADNTFYAGIATDVARRFEEHRSQGPKCSRFLRAHKPRRVLFSKRIGTRSLATKVEYHFKRLPRIRKHEIILSGRLPFDKQTGKIDLLG